jgi:hypothetical protein
MEQSVLVTIGLFALAHTAGLIWWMSKITEKISSLVESFKLVSEKLAKHEATYYTKEEASKDFAYRDQRIDAAWKKIDQLVEKS